MFGKKKYDPVDEERVREIVKSMLANQPTSKFPPLQTYCATTIDAFYKVKKVDPKPLDIKVKYFSKDVPKLEKIEQGDWIDLSLAVDTMGIKGMNVLLPLGVAMELPKGYEAIVAPRSSTYKKYGIIQTNSIGVIDNSYCGDNDQWRMPVHFTQDVVIPKGSRIAQFRIQAKQPEINFITVESLGNADRGSFGSTGD